MRLPLFRTLLLLVGFVTACSGLPAASTQTAVPVPIEATEAATLSPRASPTGPAAATHPPATASGPAPSPAPAQGTATPAAGVPDPLLDLPQVEQARRDLAQRLGVAPVDIEVLSVQATTWTDSSMGCPQPGMDYLQVLVDGLFIQLGYDGLAYNYHSGGNQPPFLCETPAGGVLPSVLDLGKTPPAPPVLP